MKKEELQKRLKYLKSKHKNNYTNVSEYKHQLKEYVHSLTKFLDDTVSEGERAWCLLNNYTKYKKCPICKQDIKNFYSPDGYRDFCSLKCSAKGIDRTRTKSQINKTRENRQQNRIKKIKQFKTILELKDFNLLSIDEIKNQLNQKFNKNRIFYIDQLIKYKDLICSIIEHTIDLSITKIENIDDLQLSFRISSIIHNKPRICKCGKQNSYYFDHVADTCLECSYKNGRITEEKSLEIREPRFTKFKEKCEEFGYSILTDFNKYDIRRNIKFKHHKCGNEFYRYQQGISTILAYEDVKDFFCPFCANLKSKPECEVLEFVKSFYKNKVYSGRRILETKYGNKRELDIYIPGRNIAIEFNGLYWHNSDFKEKYYHLEKTILSEEKGIQLLHIFENEWMFKRNIVESIIKSKFGIYDRKYFGRKCYVDEIDGKTKDSFLLNNHLQGKDKSKVKLGLFEKSTKELIAVMTFGKRRITGAKKSNWELIRFANKVNITTIGGASKLFKYFTRNYLTEGETITTYADRRYSNGNFYNNLGFELDHISQPNYWYIVDGELKHRVGYQKHKLVNIIEDFDENLSEWKNMKNNGFDRIWDCGNYVFTYQHL